jgi:N-acetyl sugar amidotransferase
MDLSTLPLALETLGARAQTCSMLVMDTTDPDICFDSNGVCNYWHEFQAFKVALPSAEERQRTLKETLDRIRTTGHGRSHDCLLGLSGGVDSSYMIYLANQFNLRPLVVHFDNGWNSELAVHNIEMLVSKFGYELETFVMEWDEFRDVQRAYFKASVVDLEVPTDHMIFGALHKIAANRGIKYILSGNNYATEWLMPKSWNYRKNDARNLKAIHRRFGSRPLEQLPWMGVWQEARYRLVNGIRMLPLLDLIDYNKTEAKSVLMNEIGWRDYGGKHYESIFTRFYQGYVLPRKFGIDKRKAHLSNLILNGELTREDALRALQQPTYDEDEQLRDKEYVAKKLGFAPEEFEAVLTQPNVPHETFGTDAIDRERYIQMVKILKRLRNVALQARR